MQAWTTARAFRRVWQSVLGLRRGRTCLLLLAHHHAFATRRRRVIILVVKETNASDYVFWDCLCKVTWWLRDFFFSNLPNWRREMLMSGDPRRGRKCTRASTSGDVFSATGKSSLAPAIVTCHAVPLVRCPIPLYYDTTHIPSDIYFICASVTILLCFSIKSHTPFLFRTLCQARSLHFKFTQLKEQIIYDKKNPNKYEKKTFLLHFIPWVKRAVFKSRLMILWRWSDLKKLAKEN